VKVPFSHAHGASESWRNLQRARDDQYFASSPTTSDAAYSECTRFALVASSTRENLPLNPPPCAGSVSHSEMLERRLKQLSYLRKKIVFCLYQV
jgi:hypothetical protein